MSGDGAGQEAARQALGEIQRYLADEIAPLMAADSAEVLLRLPAKYGAAVIRNWLEAQLTAPGRAVTVSGYIYHAVKKLHHFAELDLVDRATMDRYLNELSRVVAHLCPEREQADLRLKLSRLAEARTALSAPIRVLNREVGTEGEEAAVRQAELEAKSGAASAPPNTGAVSQRLALLMGRVDELKGLLERGPTDDETRELLARLVTKAAVESTDGTHLDATLTKLRTLGWESGLDRRMFRLLGQRLPGWEIDLERAGTDVDHAVGHLLQAMHRIVASAGSREEGVQRFSEMVYAAVDQLNEGHLAQAVAMFELAQRLIDEKKVDPELAKIVKSHAQSSVALGPLRQFASATAKHGLLRKVLRFFPIFTAESLLERLDGEPKREVRKLMLSLVEVHGSPCRPLVLDRLAGYLSGTIPDRNGFYSRNVVFLLRRIPRAAGVDERRELELLTEFSHPEQPFMVTKEAVGALANLSPADAGPVLIRRLAEFERAAMRGDLDYSAEEVPEIFDRICDGLVRLGTRETLRAIASHAGRQDARLGDTMGRMKVLAGCDLAVDPELLLELTAALRKALPSKVLGVVLARGVPEAASLVQALSGTTDPTVTRLFEEITERYPGQDFGARAAEALSRLRARGTPEAPAADGVSGDLELFGLPALLQSLGDAGQTGRLVVSERNGHDRAVIVLRSGKITNAESGPLRGLDAVCHVIERPRPGTFRFDKLPPHAPPPQGEPLEVLATLLEAIRRHDEFQQDRAIVPDGHSLMATGSRPSVPEDETDRGLVQAVWREASRGTPPEGCESAVVSDAFRVRRLYAHWLENGALRRRPAA